MRTIDRTRPVPPARYEIDLEHYAEFHELWWNPNGPAGLLHAMNGPRLEFYLRELGDPDGRQVLDAGCGGGLVAKGLAEAGAVVTGLDLSPACLLVARRAVPDGFRPAAGRMERLPFASGSFDAVVAADVLEHIPDLPAVVEEVARVLRPGGSFLFDTINRTAWAWFTALFGAERLLGFVPRGTHDWRLFIRPRELDRLLTRAGFEAVATAGLAPRIGPADIVRGLTRRSLPLPEFATGRDRRASYLGHYRKAPAGGHRGHDRKAHAGGHPPEVSAP